MAPKCPTSCCASGTLSVTSTLQGRGWDMVTAETLSKRGISTWTTYHIYIYLIYMCNIWHVQYKIYIGILSVYNIRIHLKIDYPRIPRIPKSTLAMGNQSIWEPLELTNCRPNILWTSWFWWINSSLVCWPLVTILECQHCVTPVRYWCWTSMSDVMSFTHRSVQNFRGKWLQKGTAELKVIWPKYDFWYM